mgnify:CR=1 FL=1
MADIKNFEEIESALDSILSNVDLTNVTSESTGFEELPDGYYLCEVEKAELTTSKSSGLPMVAFTLKVTENGKKENIDDKGNFELVEIKGSHNRKVFKYYILSDEKKVKSFVTDMLKFEGEVPGEPVLSKEYFLSSSVLADSLDVLTGMYIWVNVSTTERNGQKSTWTNLLSWKRAAALGLE